MDPLGRDSVRAEDEAHGEEDGPRRRLVQEELQLLGEGARLLLDLKAANVDEGRGQRPRVVQHIVRVDQHSGQIPYTHTHMQKYKIKTNNKIN